MAKVTVRGIWGAINRPMPMSLRTWAIWGAVWSFYGAAVAADTWIGGRFGLALAMTMVVPMPALVWAAWRSSSRDRRVGVKSLGDA